MILIGIYYIKANSLEDVFLKINNNYDVGFERKDNLFEIKVKKNNNNKKYYYHGSNENLFFYVLHGENGTGKTTAAKTLSFNKDFEFLLLFEFDGGYYLEGNTKFVYNYNFNDIELYDLKGRQVKSYLSLYFKDNRFDFYEMFKDNRNTRFFILDSKDKDLSVKDGYYTLPRIHMNKLTSISRMYYINKYYETIKKSVDNINLEYKLILQNPINKYIENKKIKGDIPLDDLHYTQKVVDLFKANNIDLLDKNLNLLNSFKFKLIYDSYIYLTDHNRDFIFKENKLEYYLEESFNILVDNLDLSTSTYDYNEIMKIIKGINDKKEYEIIDDEIYVEASPDSQLNKSINDLYKDYEKSLLNVSKKTENFFLNPKERQRNFDNPLTTPILNYFFRFNIEGMSAGEQKLLDYTINFSYLIENDHIYDKNTGISYIVIDEIDLHFHPELTRKVISYIIDIFEQTKSQYYFIVTTHSEYILSDIPHTNIIRLELKDEFGNKKYIQKNVDIPTFAKSIGDIALDNMIVSNALGEYAKKEVERLISLNKYTKKDIELINYIGDPFLRNFFKRKAKSYGDINDW